MCGILAILRRDGRPVDEGLAAAMRDTMRHRGPDDVGLLVEGPVALAHRRLSIVDLTDAGHQPMSNEDGSVWVVFNGEVYNYVELAAELAARGHRFRSHCDTEVIVHAWEEWGTGCLDRFVGMFGFALWDRRTRQLFVARDRIGIKPLYYHATPRLFACASEIKALLDDPAIPRRVNPVAMADYVYTGQFMAGRTPFQGIEELPPGHYLLASAEGIIVRRWWDLAFRYDRARSWDDTVAETRALLDDAVRLHCRSDAALGCHLSGGLDSSTVTSLAARYRAEMPVFAIRFAGSEPQYDETRYAREVVRACGAHYVEATPEPYDFWSVFASLVWHMDTPLFGSGGFSYYTVSQLAARSVKVTLTGHGGDEVFAGYPAQFQAAFGTTAMFPAGPRPAASLATRLLGHWRLEGPGGVWRALVRRGLGLLRAVPPRSLEEEWFRLHCSARSVTDPTLEPTFLRALGGYDPVGDYLAPFRRVETPEVLDRCLYHDLVSYLPSLLQQEDRVSMARSIESRVPLLDHRLVEHLATVPPELKVRDRTPKALLRSAARGIVPDLILDRRDKVPFSVPLRDWFRGPLWPAIRELLDSRRARERGLFRTPRGGVAPDEPDLWTRLNVEVWHRVFIDRDPEWVSRVASAAGRR